MWAIKFTTDSVTMISIDLPKKVPLPSLPQNDTPAEQEIRRAALIETQKSYQLSNDNVLGLPLLKEVPSAENFSNEYETGRAEDTAPLLKNHAAVMPTLTNPYGPFSGLADYENMFIDIPKPDVANDWLTDEIFGEQCLSGVNPVMIERVLDSVSLATKINLSQLKDELETGINLEDLIKQHQLYIIDLTPYFDGIPEGKVYLDKNDPTKFLTKYQPKPVGLFYWHSDGATLKDPATQSGRLLPLAIQIDLEDSKVKVFTPQSPELLWTIAKMCFSVANVNVHEMSTHLGRAHFAQEPFGAITPCQLAPEHPIAVLLKPHLRFLVVNNQAGIDKLVNPGGPVDQLLAATLQGSIDISVKAAKNWSVTETFPQSIEARSVASKESLPHYPYRDDGNLIWDAVVGYVNEYVGVYYKADTDIAADYEIQAWAKTLADTSATGGNIKDMPSQIDTVAQLSELLSVIIFHNSAGHSSINYPQYPYIGFSPNMPLAGYGDYRTFLAKETTTPAEQLDFLLSFAPPQALALGQIDITNSLSVYHYDTLGDYASEIQDPQAKHALYCFTQKLTAIEKRINVRNNQRAEPYKFMLPTEVLNSASI